MGPVVARLAAVACLLVATACGDDSEAGGQDAETSSPPSASAPANGPVGVVAIGHSGMTGHNSDADMPGNVKQNSWATGSSAEVNSVYLRLVDARPETEGHAANTAVNGAIAATLGAQARAALALVPEPQLVLIQTLDNDIRCDGSDADHVANFGASIAEALNLIAAESPESTILLVSNIGRPATYAVAIAEAPLLEKEGGDGACDLFTRDGLIAPERVETLTQIIEGYEAEQVRVCAAVPQCHTDGGAFSTYVYTSDALGFDYTHHNTTGHARAAETIWPTVAELLQLP